MIVCVKVLFVICTVFVAIALGFQLTDVHAKIEPKFVVDKTQIANGVSSGIWKVWKPWLVKKQDILKNMDKKLNSMLLLIPTSVSHPKPSTSAEATGTVVTQTVSGTASGNVISSGSDTGVKIPAISVHVGGSNNNAVQHLAQRPAPIVYFYHVTAPAKPNKSNRDKNQGDKKGSDNVNNSNSEGNHNHNHNGNANSSINNSPPPVTDKEKHPSVLENNSTINVALPAPVPIAPSVIPNYFIPVLLTSNLGAQNASIPQTVPSSPASGSNTQTNYGGHTFINVGYPENSHFDKEKKVFRYKGLTLKGLDQYEGIIVFLPQCIRVDSPSCRGTLPGIKTYTSTEFYGKLKPLKPNDPNVLVIQPDSDLLENESTTIPNMNTEVDLAENGLPVNLSVLGGDTQPNRTSLILVQGNSTNSNPDILKYILRKDYH